MSFYFPAYHARCQAFLAIKHNMAEREKEKVLALKELGLKISRARIQRGIPATRLSDMIGKNPSYIQKVELGIVNVSYWALLEICECLEINPKNLF